MPTTGTVNTQQLIQMGSHTEKLQQTLQHLPVITGQQLQDEQMVENEIKQFEIQDPENLEPIKTVDSEGKHRREVRLRSKSSQNSTEDPFIESSDDPTYILDSYQGKKIDITI